VASPDTDELATAELEAAEPRTVPQARIEPEAGPAPQDRAEPAAAEARTVPQARIEPDEAEPRTAPRARVEPEAGAAPQERAEPDAAEAQTVPQERVEPERIEPDVAASEPGSDSPAKERGRWWRGFTGSLAAGLTVLALGVLSVAAISLYTDAPGPGPMLLIGHPVAAVLALLAQRVADRRHGPAAVGAGLAVVLFTVSALTLFWLT
jgi:hypothetical protein